MPITKEDLLKIAALARIEVSEDELVGLLRDLSQIIAYVEQIQSIDTSGVIIKNPLVREENIYREDVAKPSLPREKALANAPDADGEYFRAPRVL